MKGLLKVAEIVGKKLSENPNDYEESWRVDIFQNKNKNIDVYDELRKAGKENKNIDIYLNSILTHPFKKWKRKTTKFTYELVKQKIESDKHLFLTSEKANQLSVEEVEKLAKDFLNEKDKQKQEKYLHFFAERKFPFDYRLILKIAKGKNPKNTRLVEFAVRSLKYFSEKDIRKLALKKITSLKNPCNYLNLLVNNYEVGDHQLLNDVADRSDDFDFIHSILYGFINIYEANPSLECKEPLEKIYNKTNCGLHRFDIVQILAKNNVLSNKIFQELQFDSSEEIQKLYKKMKSKGNKTVK